MKLPSDNFAGRKAPIPWLESGLAGTGDCVGSEGEDGVDGRKKGGVLRTFIVMNIFQKFLCCLRCDPVKPNVSMVQILTGNQVPIE